MFPRSSVTVRILPLTVKSSCMPGPAGSTSRLSRRLPLKLASMHDPHSAGCTKCSSLPSSWKRMNSPFGRRTMRLFPPEARLVGSVRLYSTSASPENAPTPTTVDGCAANRLVPPAPVATVQLVPLLLHVSVVSQL